MGTVAKLTKVKPWMIESAYGVASMLPGDEAQALAVLAIAKQLVLLIHDRYVRPAPAASEQRRKRGK